jgi:adenylosuccinate synthase
MGRIGDRDLDEAFVAAAQGLDPAGVTLTTAPPRAERTILEGAQGALLDREHGFYPHVTPSRITRAAAEDAVRALGLDGPVEVWGVLRAVHTRHGAGPLPSEDAELGRLLPERHNRDDGWAGRFRFGWLDAVLACYAIGFAGPIDRLALTCLDRVEPLPRRAVVPAWATPDGRVTAADLARLDAPARTAVAFAAVPVLQELGPGVALAGAVADCIGRPVDLESWGPTVNEKRPRARIRS